MLPEPYTDKSANVIYNLLFCDHPELFRSPMGQASTADLLNDPNADPATVHAIAENVGEESRHRALAFGWLRQRGIRPAAKVLLGVIVEMPTDGGLDTLATYADGRIRYIHHSGKMAIVESASPDIERATRDLLAVARVALDRIGPWNKPRLPPPAAGTTRLSFLVSDGLYFGQGPVNQIAKDPIGGQILQQATKVLSLITRATQTKQAR